MSKSVAQLSEKTSFEDDDLFHIVRNNVDYKAKYSNIKATINRTIKVSLTAAQLKTGFSSPITAVAAPGALYALYVRSVNLKFTDNTTPFTNSDVIVYIDTSNSELFQASSILDSGADSFGPMSPSYAGSGTLSLVANKAILIKADADSAVGDGTAILYIDYQIITL